MMLLKELISLCLRAIDGKMSRVFCLMMFKQSSLFHRFFVVKLKSLD